MGLSAIFGVSQIINVWLSDVTSTRKSSMEAIDNLMHEYSDPEFAMAIREIVRRSLASKSGSIPFAYEWAVAKRDVHSNKHREAEILDDYRRKWIFFYNKLRICHEGGSFDIRGPMQRIKQWTQNNVKNEAIEFFPGSSRAKTFILHVQPMEYANCRIVLKKTQKECNCPELMPQIVEYLKHIYPQIQDSDELREVQQIKNKIEELIKEERDLKKERGS